jgi:hypothetical protein
MQNRDYSEFRRAVTALIGQHCLLVPGEASTESMVALHFGARSAETVSPAALRSFTPERATCRLSMDFAAWRCRLGARFLCSSSSPGTNSSTVKARLGILAGRRVERVELVDPTMDLCLWFQGGAEFSIFCEQVEPEGKHVNYFLTCRRGSFIVGPGSAFRFVAGV